MMSDGVRRPQYPFIVTCIPAFNEEDRIASVIVMAGMTVEAICPSMSMGLPWAVCLTSFE
jgi:hypothetical protein